MKYIFLGKIVTCPIADRVGGYAYHTVTCDENGLLDMEMQTIEDTHYRVPDLQSLISELSSFKETTLLVNGIPEELFRRFVPDAEYVMGRLSTIELKSLLDKSSLEFKVA